MIIETAISWITSEISSYAFSKLLDKAFENKEEFETELYKTISTALIEFEHQNPILQEKGKFAFYDSQIIVDELLKFRLFGENGYSIDEKQIQAAIEKNPNIIKPTKEQLETFLRIFDETVNNNERLKKLEINENYKEKIFTIDNTINKVFNLLELHLIETVGLLEDEYKEEINECYNEIEVLKFNSALERLKKIENRVESNSIHVSNKLKASIQFNIALCQETMGNNTESYQCFIKAYKLSPQNSQYLNRACISYYSLKDKKYIALKQSIEENEDYNTYCWAINTFESPDILMYLIESVPPAVLENHQFRRLIFNHNQLFQKVNQLELLKLLLPENIKYELPDFITYNNFHHWLFILYTLSFQFFTKFEIVFHGNDTNKIDFEPFFSLSKILSDAIINGELNKSYYRVIFIKYWLEIEHNIQINTIDKLCETYEQLPEKDSFITLLYANSIQKHIGTKEAFEIIEKYQGEKDVALLSLKTYCQLLNPQIPFSLSDFFNSIERNDEFNIQHLCNSIVSILKYKTFDIVEFNDNIDRFEYIDSVYKELIKALGYSIKGNGTIPIEQINYIKESFKNEPELNFYIAILFFENKYYEECISYIRSYIDESKESRDLLLYIEVLNAYRKNSQTELLHILERWRNQFTFNDYLLRIETELRQILRDWESIFEIAKYALENLPNDEPFFVFYINSIAVLKKTDLLEELIPRILEFQFRRTENVLRICGILLEYKYYEQTLRLIYEKAKNQDDVLARSNYFTLTLDIPPGYLIEYEIVKDDCFVRFEIDGELKVKYIDAKKSEPIIVNSIGKKKGDEFSLQSNLSSKFKFVKIHRIMNKYLALFDEICLDANSSFSELPFETITFEGNNADSFNKTFIELFGAKEAEFKEYRDKRLSEYYKYSISFSELTSSNFKNNFIDAYTYLNSTESNGFYILPLKYLNPNIIFTNKRNVIDFTSGLLFYELEKKFNIKFEKFIISKNHLSYIEDLIRQAKQDSKSNLTVSINENNIIPYFYNERFHEERISFYNSFLNWIKENTEAIVPEEKIDLIRPLYDDGKIEPLFECTIDNAFLAQREQYFLISDDLSYKKLLPMLNDKISTTEYYLRTKYPDKINEFIEYLLQKRYIGISINLDILISAYINRHKEGQNHIYNYAIRNITLTDNFSDLNISVIVDFLKEIAKMTPIKEQYGIEATRILTLTISSINKPTDLSIITSEIKNKFYLMGNYLTITLKAFSDALKIINRNYN